MTIKKYTRTGHPSSSRRVRVVPEFRDRPDVESLGRALIAIARGLAEKDKHEKQTSNINGWKRDTVP